MRSHLFSIRVAILMLLMLYYCVMSTSAGEVASQDDVMRGLDTSALDPAALRQLGGTGGFEEYRENPVLKPGLPGFWDAKNCDIRVAVYAGKLDELTEPRKK
jgi:hypothetical protein